MAQACPFLFPGELACPDVPGQAHSGRAETKTPVPMGLWTTLFSHRSEHQWGANWSFSYLRWNYWFRSNLNAAKPLICTRHIKDAAGPLTAAEVLQGATQITRAAKPCKETWGKLPTYQDFPPPHDISYETLFKLCGNWPEPMECGDECVVSPKACRCTTDCQCSSPFPRMKRTRASCSA